MGYRKFVDRDGRAWDVRDRSRSEWTFQPEAGNPQAPVDVPAPGYEKDPFELSNEELQKILDAALGDEPRAARKKKSPFLDE